VKHAKVAQKFIDCLSSIILVRKGIQAYLQPFGSLKSGFGTRKSDLDLCIKLTTDEITSNNEIEVVILVEYSLINCVFQKDGVKLLCNIGDALQEEGGFELNYVFAAKVPILRFKYSNGKEKFKADICFSNQLALFNTKMLATYASLDERIAPLGLAIKKWALTFGINDPSTHTLSSYGKYYMFR
jgi:terminal uridylyltransferase